MCKIHKDNSMKAEGEKWKNVIKIFLYVRWYDVT